MLGLQLAAHIVMLPETVHGQLALSVAVLLVLDHLLAAVRVEYPVLRVVLWAAMLLSGLGLVSLLFYLLAHRFVEPRRDIDRTDRRQHKVGLR